MSRKVLVLHRPPGKLLALQYDATLLRGVLKLGFRSL